MRSLASFGLGAALMYFLDPQSGRRRRSEARDKAVHLVHETNEAMDVASRDLENRMRGAVATVESTLRREHVPDEVLVERVRSKLGRVSSHPHAIEVSCEDGAIVLEGPVLSNELRQVLSAIGRVRGVRKIQNRLDPHRSTENVPALQGGEPRREVFELLQRNWSPGPRLVVGATGAILALGGLRRGGVVGTLCMVGGGLAFARSVTNLDFRRLLGIGAGRRAIDLTKTIDVNAPVEQVFAWLSAPENFPRFMSHVRSVKRTSERRYHWKVTGPANVDLDWDALVTRLEPNQLLAWRSEPGSMVGHAGSIRFESTPDGRTRISIRMSYNPPAGALGHAFAKLLGTDPKHQMDEDLIRFKSLMEQGKATAHGQTVFRDELRPDSEKLVH
jgi:uncharacterized membrane protein